MGFDALALTCLLIGTALAADEWKYEGEYGVQNWKYMSEACAGWSQSPINIDTSNLIYDEYLATDPFTFHNYYDEKDLDILMTNNGHSVQLLFEGTQRYITGGSLPSRYNLLQIHFHWGINSWQGSEHSLDNKLFPMEMHVVHTRDGYPVDTALTSPEGLAVLGFFFAISEYDNPAMNRLLDYFQSIVYDREKVDIPSFPLASLFPDNLHHFYRYSGSLTTPGCFETVIWTVFNYPIMISERQVEIFRSIREDKMTDNHTEPDYMYNNYRPVQDLNGRPVYTTDPYQGRVEPVNGDRVFTLSWMCALLAFGSYLALL